MIFEERKKLKMWTKAFVGLKLEKNGLSKKQRGRERCLSEDVAEAFRFDW